MAALKANEWVEVEVPQKALKKPRLFLDLEKGKLTKTA